MQQAQEMNKFLKGIHMGASSFRDFYNCAKSDELKQVFFSIEDSFRRHETVITNLILKYGADATDTKSVMGAVSSVVERTKLMMVNDDFKLCQMAINAINMGILAGAKFIHTHKSFNNECLVAMKGIVKDYDNHLTRIKQLMINY